MANPQYIRFDATHHLLICQGDWNLKTLPLVEKNLESLSLSSSSQLIIDGNALSAMDTSGAWLISQFLEKIKKTTRVSLQNFSEQHQELLSLVQSKHDAEKQIPPRKKLSFLERLGARTINSIKELFVYLTLIGELTLQFLTALIKPGKFRLRAIGSIVESSGFQALSIIALLSFMIGVVLTYQMGLQLKTYGANIFIVNLLGLALLREFSPLITAIMVAGRTGSAFTAQLGTMKLNQEIDALKTMGISTSEILLLPRLIGLTIALPLLSVWSDIFGVFGGMVMSKSMLDISWYDFLQRFQSVISLKTFIIGLAKTPVFALIIASISCYQGMQVSGNSDSVGKKTTQSVVLSIFFIIIADAFFSIVLSLFKL